MNKFVIALAAVSTIALAGCEGTPSSDDMQNQRQEQLSKQGVEAVGLPAIKNFQEKRILKDIIELRDDPHFATYTYITDLNGHLHLRCHSIGYGIPYATQYTNPLRVARGNETPDRGNVTLPQADPNGLFSPASAEGTWVLCKNPRGDDVKPIYVEDRVTVSPFPLDNN